MAREITTPEVLKAFERAKFVNLPESVKKHYEDEEKRYINYSDYMETEIAKGRAEGEAKGRIEEKRKTARALL